MNLIKHFLLRNSFCMDGSRANPKRVNLEYYRSTPNLGDALSPLIVEKMLLRREFKPDQPTPKTSHLCAIGSLLGGSVFSDAVVWGSGIQSFNQVGGQFMRRNRQRLDIRAVRGPLTGDILRACGYRCPEVYGDPAVLMPLFYQPDRNTCPSEIVYIPHFHQKSQPVPEGITVLDIQTENYQDFITQMCKAKKVISSSLHGLILAESYGIPAVFYGSGRSGQILKYYDWYFSTGRYNVTVAQTLDEAITATPMELPELSGMQRQILDAFPYDLWECQ